MHRILGKLRQVDVGALIASEYLFITTILIIGIVVGLTNLRETIGVELTELGNAILAWSQDDAISGSSGGAASIDASQAIDTPALLPQSTLTPPTALSLIDQKPCNQYPDNIRKSPFVPGRNEGALLLRRRT